MSWTVYEHITPSGKRYIGITSKKPEERWLNGRGYDTENPFGKAIKKYGWDNIQHNIVSSDLTETEAKWLENYLICYYSTYVGFSDCKGYNCTLGGDGAVGRPAWNKGIHIDDETKRKISETMKGKPGPNKGKPSPNKGKHISVEHKRKISEAQTGDKNYWYGKHRPKETCIKMSEASKGKHRVYHEDGTFHMER